MMCNESVLLMEDVVKQEFLFSLMSQLRGRKKGPDPLIFVSTF